MELNQTKNQTTGSTYYGIGETGSMLCSLRVWVVEWSTVAFGVANLGVRVRFEPMNGVSSPIESLADFEFPNIGWTGGGNGQSYVSKFAALTTGFESGHGFEHVLLALQAAGALESVYKELQAKFPTVQFYQSEEEFAEFFLSKIKEDIPKPGVVGPYYFKWIDPQPQGASQGFKAH